jgi:hypothetical protein
VCLQALCQSHVSCNAMSPQIFKVVIVFARVFNANCKVCVMEAYAHEFLQCEVMIDGSGDFPKDLSNLGVNF